MSGCLGMFFPLVFVVLKLCRRHVSLILSTFIGHYKASDFL